MPIALYNSLTREKEPLETREPNKLGMYVCGVTPYDFSHIGHARCYVTFDLVFRYLRYKGYDVTYVRNFTDIDDKIIRRAAEAGEHPFELSARFATAFVEDMHALGCLDPQVQPKVTETIPEIIEMVREIIEKGRGYAVDGDVYFATQAMPDYGKLSQRPLEEMRAGARVEVDTRKQSPLDFALWKSAKPGEPSWPSPWGDGRPGWHIECSAMSRKFLGDDFEIHGGGKDLLFPHHENEVAQSESCTGHQHVRYWMHNGFVNIDNEKMSKSLGNFFTIRDVLKYYHPESLRMFLLTTHYRAPINYSDANLDDARKRMDYTHETLARALNHLGTRWKAIEPRASDMYDSVFSPAASLRTRLTDALDDDFNAPKAIGETSELFRNINLLLDKKAHVAPEAAAGVLHDALRYVKECSTIFGVWLNDPADYLAMPQGKRQSRMPAEEVEALIAARQEARKDKNFKLADDLRDQIAAAGIELKDTPQGPVWRYSE